MDTGSSSLTSTSPTGEDAWSETYKFLLPDRRHETETLNRPSLSCTEVPVPYKEKKSPTTERKDTLDKGDGTNGTLQDINFYNQQTTVS